MFGLAFSSVAVCQHDLTLLLTLITSTLPIGTHGSADDTVCNECLRVLACVHVGARPDVWPD
jgi:hypothetical protein